MSLTTSTAQEHARVKQSLVETIVLTVERSAELDVYQKLLKILTTGLVLVLIGAKGNQFPALKHAQTVTQNVAHNVSALLNQHFCGIVLSQELAFLKGKSVAVTVLLREQNVTVPV